MKLPMLLHEESEFRSHNVITNAEDVTMMSEGVSASPPRDGVKHDTLQVTISEPLSPLKPLRKKDSGSPELRSSSPLGPHKKKDRVGGSFAKAFRKVFRSRTPSPSTEDREEDAGSEAGEEFKCDLSSDSDGHDSHRLLLRSRRSPESQESVERHDLASVVLNSHALTTSHEEFMCESPKEFLSVNSPGLGKSQTYSVLSEALHHAFVEGMICTGTEDISVVTSSEELQCQGSKSENDYEHSRSIDCSFSSTKTCSYVSSEECDAQRRDSEVPLTKRSLLVPSVSLRSSNYSDHSDVGTDDDSSSQHSRDERQDSVSLHHNDHKLFFGHFFSSSRRSSMIPQAEEHKGEGAVPHAKHKDNPSGNPGEHGKGHKTLGDTLSKVAEYLQRGGSRLAEQQRRLKSQIWSSVVTIVLVEGKELLPMDPDGTSDPYVKFRLGNEKYKSKVEMHTLTPKWLEQFDFHLFEDQSQLLELTVWDKDVRSKDDFMGRCTLDLTQYEREKTHHIWAELEKGAGSIFLLLTISGTTSSETISDLHSYQENPRELENVSNRYTVTRSLHNLKDIGQLRVKVYRAQGLAAADIGGKSDPFCVLELCNARLQTQTEYKTLSPTWNKIFTFNVKDIHNVLDITVYDEDRDHKVEFLGKVVIPLLRMKNGEKKWYPLKDKKLRARAKGNNPEILLECSVEWNPIRAAIRTFTPREEKYMQTEQKFKRQVFIKNVNRLKSSIMDFYELGKFIKSCWEWESPVRSIIAFILFMVITYYFEVYMLPILLLMLFLRNYIVISIVGSMHREEESELSGDEEEVDDDDKDKHDTSIITLFIYTWLFFQNMSVEVRKTESRKECGINASPNDLKSKEEKKTLKERLQVIQEVTATVQNAIGYIASIFESCKNTFNFSVPFLSWLLIMVLMVGSVVLYYIPVRYLVMMWGVNKFSRKLLRPHSMVNNELLDFLSRVPDDELLRDCRELRPIPQSHDEKRRDQRKKKVA
ncbi:multiple C2 and transmembrane domain-containing protein-like isoform X16 [Penaeus japonicus]|uniref:multiple C2 and transmembrane domain-containing protein-like isoform X16 n=1 Tax=Penaeus japonicus TaxID=27405 RepID=UPI001C712D0E|nr:multiple C2 and transmembrane domain-containing protein-like isoform X16 [Penaeus japonicus]